MTLGCVPESPQHGPFSRLKRRFIVGGVVLVIVAATLFHRWGRKDDPVVSGKHLSEWCRQLRYAQPYYSHDAPCCVEAEAAIRSLGTNAIKSLLAELYATNTPVELAWINKRTAVRNWVKGKFSDEYQPTFPEADPNYAEQRNYAAMWGLRALGQPGISVLTGYLHSAAVDRPHAHYAAYVLAMLPDGMTFLLPALNDADPAKRMMALLGLKDAARDCPPRMNAAVLVPKLFEILGTASVIKERIFAADLLIQWSRPQLQIVSPDKVAEALIKQIPTNINVALLSEQLRGLMKSGNLNAANSNQVLKLLDDRDTAAFEARFGK